MTTTRDALTVQSEYSQTSQIQASNIRAPTSTGRVQSKHLQKDQYTLD